MKKYNLKNAFTLIEVMIVVVIIGLMAAMVIPAIQKIREQNQPQYQQVELPVEPRGYRSDARKTNSNSVGFFVGGLAVGFSFGCLFNILYAKNREKNTRKMLQNRW